MYKSSTVIDDAALISSCRSSILTTSFLHADWKAALCWTGFPADAPQDGEFCDDWIRRCSVEQPFRVAHRGRMRISPTNQGVGRILQSYGHGWTGGRLRRVGSQRKVDWKQPLSRSCCTRHLESNGSEWGKRSSALHSLASLKGETGLCHRLGLARRGVGSGKKFSWRC